MQYSNKVYNGVSAEKRDTLEGFKALTVKLPYAQWIANGVKTWEIKPQPTKYRGKLVITSSYLPKIEEMISGSAICTVDLIDCVMVKDLPEKDWVNSMLSKESRNEHIYSYAYILRGARPTIEIPVKGQLGIWNLILDKDELMEYPQELDHYVEKAKAAIIENNLKKTGKIVVTIAFVILLSIGTLFYILTK